MKNKFLTFCMTLFFGTVFAQDIAIKDVSNSNDLNYIFSRMNTDEVILKNLFDHGLQVKIFKISDSKNTPENFSEGTEEFLESLFISISPDGDSYTSSKLYKLEGLIFPDVIEISESEYPKINLKIEQGNKNNRSQKAIQLVGLE